MYPNLNNYGSSACSYGWGIENGNLVEFFQPSNTHNPALRRVVQVFHGIPNVLENQESLRTKLGSSKVALVFHSHYDADGNNVYITEPLRTKEEMISIFKAEFYGQSKVTNWAEFSKKELSKMMNFCSYILAEVWYNGTLALPDLYNSIFYREETEEIVLKAGADIACNPYDALQMVRDVQSIIALFGDLTHSEHVKPAPNHTLDNSVPQSLRFFRDYLMNDTFFRYDKEVAFNCPIFWTPEQVYDSAVASHAELNRRNKQAGPYAEFYEICCQKHIPVDWIATYDPNPRLFGAELVICETAWSGKSEALQTCYTRSMARNDPPSYDTSASFIWFFKNLCHHISRDPSECLELSFNEFERHHAFAYRLFRIHLEYFNHVGPNEKADLMNKLGFT